jgi:hemerythrin-like domain-containing protein
VTGNSERKYETGTAHVTELSESLERLRREHNELKQVLQEMETQARQVEQEPEKALSMKILLDLRLWTLAFREELERHSNWEEKELFPFLNQYFKSKKSPVMNPSFWALEKDHELADEYMQSFLRAVHALKANPEAMRLNQAAAYLVHACRILKEHLDKEELLIVPMTE